MVRSFTRTYFQMTKAPYWLFLFFSDHAILDKYQAPFSERAQLVLFWD